MCSLVLRWICVRVGWSVMCLTLSLVVLKQLPSLESCARWDVAGYLHSLTTPPAVMEAQVALSQVEVLPGF